MQCESTAVYTLGGEEQEYFAAVAVKMMEAMRPIASHSIPLYEALVLRSELLEPATIKYHNLRHVRDPILDALTEEQKSPDYRPDEYELYTHGTDTYAINPVGQHFLALKPQWAALTFELVVTVDLGATFELNKDGERADRTITYAARFSLKPLTRVLDYAPHVKHRTTVVKVEAGEILADTFIAWPGDALYLTEKTLISSLKYDAWMSAWTPPPVSIDDDTPCFTGEMQFMNLDGKLCTYKKFKKGEGEWIALTNFEIEDLVSISEFADRDLGTPRFRLRVRCKLHDENDQVQLITPESVRDLAVHEGSPGVLLVEVVVPIMDLEKPKALATIFSKADSRLNTCGQAELHPWHLKSFLNTLAPWPKPTRICTFFGRQSGSELFVFGNCGVLHGRVVLLDELSLAIDPNYFVTGTNGLLRTIPEHFPRIVMGMPTWIQYQFYTKTFLCVFKALMLDNSTRGKVVWAASIMHLQASKFWGGQGVGKCCASLWAQGPAYTGKSLAIEFANSFAGYSMRRMSNAACTSEAAIFHQSTQQADLPLCFDELVHESDKKVKDIMRKWKNIIHAMYDQTTRCVLATANSTGASLPKSPIIGSSNTLINECDEAFMQRLLLVTFPELQGDGLGWTQTQKTAQWTAHCELASCLLPVFTQLLRNGKLDRPALSDCCSFMLKICAKTFSRNANLWGFTLYYLLQMTAMAQGDHDDFDEIFDYICKSVVKQDFLATRHQNVLDRFISAVQRVQALGPSRDPAGSVNWHNYRTLISPTGYLQLNQGSWVAIRLESMCHVIKERLREYFTAAELLATIEEMDCATCNRGMFYDLTKCPWPIEKVYVDPATNVSAQVPLLEEELLQDHLMRYRCIFIKKHKWDQVAQVQHLAERVVVDYKQVRIDSANVGDAEYNFWAATTGRLETAWFGYRVLLFTDFAKYCGMTNLCEIPLYSTKGYKFEVERMHAEGGWQPVDYYMNAEVLLEYFGPTRMSGAFPADLPPCYVHNPFIFRNEEGDEPIDDPPTKPVEKHPRTGTPRSPAQRSVLSEESPGGRRDGAGSTPGSAANGPQAKRPRVQEEENLADLAEVDENESEGSWHASDDDFIDDSMGVDADDPDNLHMYAFTEEELLRRRQRPPRIPSPEPEDDDEPVYRGPLRATPDSTNSENLNFTPSVGEPPSPAHSYSEL
jgi:hypothetical protein